MWHRRWGPRPLAPPWSLLGRLVSRLIAGQGEMARLGLAAARPVSDVGLARGVGVEPRGHQGHAHRQVSTVVCGLGSGLGPPDAIGSDWSVEGMRHEA